jgi:hypothetical protein
MEQPPRSGDRGARRGGFPPAPYLRQVLQAVARRLFLRPISKTLMAAEVARSQAPERQKWVKNQPKKPESGTGRGQNFRIERAHGKPGAPAPQPTFNAHIESAFAFSRQR